MTDVLTRYKVEYFKANVLPAGTLRSDSVHQTVSAIGEWLHKQMGIHLKLLQPARHSTASKTRLRGTQS